MSGERNRGRLVALLVGVGAPLLCVILLAAAIAIDLAVGDLRARRNNDFDEETAGLVDVATRDYDTGEAAYLCLASEGRCRPIEAFEGDDARVYQARRRGPLDLLTSRRLEDDAGNPVPLTEGLRRIYDRASEIDHVVMDMRVFDTEAGYFVCIELNVNLWWPCGLYYFDESTNRLIELYTFDAKEITGLRVRNIGLLK